MIELFRFNHLVFACLMVTIVALTGCQSSSTVFTHSTKKTDLSDDEKCTVAVFRLLFEIFHSEQTGKSENLAAILDPSMYIFSVKRTDKENIYYLQPIISEKLKIFRRFSTSWPTSVTVDRKTHEVIRYSIAG